LIRAERKENVHWTFLARSQLAGEIHVEEGKGKKDPYVPLVDILIRGLKAYLEAAQPSEWVFNSKDQEIKGRVSGDFDSRYSQWGVQ
jgi:integrase/recombinase XerD